MSETQLEQAVRRRIESFQPPSAPEFDEVLSRHRTGVRARPGLADDPGDAEPAMTGPATLPR